MLVNNDASGFICHVVVLGQKKKKKKVARKTMTKAMPNV